MPNVAFLAADNIVTPSIERPDDTIPLDHHWLVAQHKGMPPTRGAYDAFAD